MLRDGLTEPERRNLAAIERNAYEVLAQVGILRANAARYGSTARDRIRCGLIELYALRCHTLATRLWRRADRQRAKEVSV